MLLICLKSVTSKDWMIDEWKETAYPLMGNVCKHDPPLKTVVDIFQGGRW